jgi:thioredoxin-dependent peroxiredoxin
MPRGDENHDYSAALAIERRDQNGAPRRLADFRGHNLVVFFYPKDDTPGCTVEGKEFRDHFEEFQELDTVVVGVSTDPVDRHLAFATKHAFPFLLLADEGGELSEAFGVLKGTRASRTTFVFDQELRVRRVFQEVTPRGHASQVLNLIRALVESHRMIGG